MDINFLTYLKLASIIISIATYSGLQNKERQKKYACRVGNPLKYIRRCYAKALATHRPKVS